MSKDARIVFMGTADFAVPSLEALVKSGHQIVAVVTMPDKPMGRGHKLRPSNVKLKALELGIEVLQPVKLSAPEFIDKLQSLHIDLGIVVAFRMLPKEVWSLPKMGTINLHSSLLPQFRGAAPINRAIMCGEKETGVSCFVLKHEIDMGDVLQQKSTLIGKDENAGELHDRLMMIGADLLVDTVDKYLAGDIVAKPQSDFENSTNLKPAPKIFKEDCKIDWSQTRSQLHNFVRGLSPYPLAWSDLKILASDMQTYKIFEIDPNVEDVQIPDGLGVGECFTVRNKQLFVICQDGAVRLLRLQAPGKKPMKDIDLLNGMRN